MRGKVKCQECGKIVTRIYFNRHKICHRNKNLGIKYECKLCEKKFAERSCVRIHLKRIHDKTENIDEFINFNGKIQVKEKQQKRKRKFNNNEKIKCEKCEKMINNRNIAEHNSTHELKETGKVLKCKFCYSKFFHLKSLGKHFRKKHKSKKLEKINGRLKVPYDIVKDENSELKLLLKSLEQLK